MFQLPSPTRAAGFALVCGSITLGLMLNGMYAWGLGAGWFGAALYSAAVKLLIPFSPQWWRQWPLLLAFGAALLTDITLGIGHGRVTRGSAIEAHVAAVEKHDAATADVKRLEKELAAIVVPTDPARSSAAIQAAIDGTKARFRCRVDAECAGHIASDKALKAEADRTEAAIARAQAQRTATSTELAQARRRLEATPRPMSSPDPLAQWVSDLTGWGLLRSADALMCLVILVIELGAIAGALMMGAAPNTIPERKPGPSPPAGGRKVAAAVPSALAAVQDLASGRKVSPGLVVGADGWISGGQRQWGAALGVTGTTAIKQLSGLEASGSIELQIGKSGTKVKLK